MAWEEQLHIYLFLTVANERADHYQAVNVVSIEPSYSEVMHRTAYYYLESV
jgi:hypothetical protein